MIREYETLSVTTTQCNDVIYEDSFETESGKWAIHISDTRGSTCEIKHLAHIIVYEVTPPGELRLYSYDR